MDCSSGRDHVLLSVQLGCFVEDRDSPATVSGLHRVASEPHHSRRAPLATVASQSTDGCHRAELIWRLHHTADKLGTLRSKSSMLHCMTVPMIGLPRKRPPFSLGLRTVTKWTKVVLVMAA